MQPIQLLQGLWTLILAILRMVGLAISAIPGTQGMVKYLPWMKKEDFEKAEPIKVKTWKDTRNEYYNQPEQIEHMRRARLSKAERIIEDNQVFTKKHFVQSTDYDFTYKVKGTIVHKAP